MDDKSGEPGPPSGQMSQGRQPEILQKLSASARAQFLDMCQEKRLAAGEHLFDQGTRHARTYLIKKGLVRTYYLAASGREITLAYWSDGDLVGGPDFLGGHDHIWSARAIEPTDVLAISGTDLNELSRRYPDVALSVIAALSFKLRWISLLLQIHCTESVVQRLAHLLVMLGEMYGVPEQDGILIRHHFSQTDLATIAGASRQWVSKTLHELQDAGKIGLQNRQIVIRDIEGLRRLEALP